MNVIFEAVQSILITMIGIGFFVASILCLLGKYEAIKYSPLNEFIKRRLSDDAKNWIRIVSSIVFALFGVYLVLKGILDPDLRHLLIRF